jgi:two-component system response regulator DegU
MKLLLVDDNDRIRKMMRHMYSAHFDEVIECRDGIEALAAFNDSNPDWVVMDINLPAGKAGMKEMDGIEATTKIISSHPDAKVIIVSQYNDESTIDAAKKAGALEFVSKENLYKVIEVISNNLKGASL